MLRLIFILLLLQYGSAEEWREAMPRVSEFYAHKDEVPHLYQTTYLMDDDTWKDVRYPVTMGEYGEGVYVTSHYPHQDDHVEINKPVNKFTYLVHWSHVAVYSDDLELREADKVGRHKVRLEFQHHDTVRFFIQYNGVADSVLYNIERIPLPYNGYAVWEDDLRGHADYVGSFDAYEENWLGDTVRVGTHVDYKIFLGAPKFREKPRILREIVEVPAFPCGEYRLSIIWQGRSVSIVQHVFRVYPFLSSLQRLLIWRERTRRGFDLDPMIFCRD